jgi:hypothetical protein
VSNRVPSSTTEAKADDPNSVEPTAGVISGATWSHPTDTNAGDDTAGPRLPDRGGEVDSAEGDPRSSCHDTAMTDGAAEAAPAEQAPDAPAEAPDADA